MILLMQDLSQSSQSHLTKMVYDIHVALLVLVQRFHGNKFWFDGYDGYRGKVTIVWRKRWRSKKCSMIWMVQWFILFWVKDLDGSWVETVWQYLKEKWWESNSLVEGVVVTRQERVCGGTAMKVLKGSRRIGQMN